MQQKSEKATAVGVAQMFPVCGWLSLSTPLQASQWHSKQTALKDVSHKKSVCETQGLQTKSRLGHEKS